MNWIKVEDQLPKRNELIGYVYDGKEIRHDVSYPGYNGSWESENRLGYSIDEPNITHWMPLPDKPSK